MRWMMVGRTGRFKDDDGGDNMEGEEVEEDSDTVKTKPGLVVGLTRARKRLRDRGGNATRSSRLPRQGNVVIEHQRLGVGPPRKR